MEKTNSELALREVRLRAHIAGLSLLCLVGSSLLGIGIGWLWLEAGRAWALVLLVGWVAFSLPFFAFMAIMVGDLTVCLVTGYTFFVPTILRWGELEDARRKLARKPPLRGETTLIQEAVWGLLFYTNPLSPLLVLMALYLSSKPPMDAVKEAALRIRSNPPARIVGEIGIGVGQHIGVGAAA
jgi:hypothetical protein